MGRWLKVNQACLPDEILWQNIGYNTFNRRVRKCVIWIIAVLLIMGGIISVVFIKAASDELKEEFQTYIDCPASVDPGILHEIAWLDQQKE